MLPKPASWTRLTSSWSPCPFQNEVTVPFHLKHNWARRYQEAPQESSVLHTYSNMFPHSCSWLSLISLLRKWLNLLTAGPWPARDPKYQGRQFSLEFNIFCGISCTRISNRGQSVPSRVMIPLSTLLSQTYVFFLTGDRVIKDLWLNTYTITCRRVPHSQRVLPPI